MKVLNLDKLDTKSNRVLSALGVDHPILQTTVQGFIDTTRRVQELSAPDADPADQMEATTDMILRSVPTLDRTYLMSRPLDTLNAIVHFIQGEDIPGVEEREEGDAEGK